jgi:PAS domain S-box-containing protein
VESAAPERPETGARRRWGPASVRARVLAAAVLVLAPVGVLVLLTLLAVDAERRAAGQERDTREVLRESARLAGDLAELGAALAGPGTAAGSPAAEAARSRLTARLTALDGRVRNDPEQSGRLARIRAELSAGPEGSARTGTPDGLRREVAGLVEAGARRLEADARASDGARQRIGLALLAGVAMVLAGGAGAGLLLARRVVGPVRALARQVGGDGAGPGGGESGDEVERLGTAFARLGAEVRDREADLARTQREAEAFAEVQRDLAETLESTALLQKIARHARSLTRSDLVFIAPFDPHAGVARVVALLGERTAALRHLRIEPGRGLAGQVLQTRQPLRTESYLEDPRFHGTTDPVVAEGVVAHLVVPMVQEQAGIGLIGVANRSATTFTDRDEAVLLNLAGPAALAVRNARLVTELAQERDLLAVRSRERIRSEAQLRGIVQAATDGIFTLDAQGHITSVNRAGHVMFGYGPQDLLARDLSVIVPEPLEDPGHTTGPARREVLGVKRDGSRFPIELSVSVVKTEHDHFLAVVVRDITDRKRAFETRFQLAAIVDSSDDAIIGWRPDLTVVSWNPGAERLYGYAAAEVLGQPVTGLVPPDREAELAGFAARLGRGEHVATHETVRRARDGRLIDVSLTVSATRDERGRITGYSTIERDITERKTIERLKDEFVATVSHELRTPLTAIRGHLELVLDEDAGPVSEQQREFLTVASQSTDRLGTLIDDLLDVDKLEAGKMAMRQEPVDLAALLREVAATFRLPAERKGLLFREEIPDRLVTVGDRDRLSQVFANLASNALKYTARGEVGIQARRLAEGIEVVVHDTGAGIAPEDQRHLFTKFFRSADPAVRDAGGTGLGLVIALATVKQHGGTIQVESRKGTGSRFRVTLP